ncbi:MAG: hypothetical protein O7F08_01870 [Deltaproteobacteria bacterium]|nr:hypothetical protein [Deltaproteobacteria bacterium]
MPSAKWGPLELPARQMWEGTYFLWSGRELLGYVLLTGVGWQASILDEDAKHHGLGLPEHRDDAEDLVVIYQERDGYEVENRIEDVGKPGSSIEQMDEADG